MSDGSKKLTVTISEKTFAAMLGFLKKHGYGAEDIDQFVEDAVTWRILDRQLAFLKSEEGEEESIFLSHEEEETFEKQNVA